MHLLLKGKIFTIVKIDGDKYYCNYDNREYIFPLKYIENEDGKFISHTENMESTTPPVRSPARSPGRNPARSPTRSPVKSPNKSLNKSNIFHDNIEKITKENTAYRRVIFTEPKGYFQLVLMSLLPKEDIEMEVHPNNTQFFRIESGQGKAIVDGVDYTLKDGIALTVPANHHHRIINTSSTEYLKFYTIYAPANHPANTLQFVKPEND